MADKTELLQAIDDAILDADSLEKFINGSDSETVLTRLSAEYPTLQNAISQINGKLDDADAQMKQAVIDLFKNGGLPATPFTTKALMEASALVDGDYAIVTNDTVNNGLYVKEGSSWVQSSIFSIVSDISEANFNSPLSIELALKLIIGGLNGVYEKPFVRDGYYHKDSSGTYSSNATLTNTGDIILPRGSKVEYGSWVSPTASGLSAVLIVFNLKKEVVDVPVGMSGAVRGTFVEGEYVATEDCVVSVSSYKDSPENLPYCTVSYSYMPADIPAIIKRLDSIDGWVGDVSYSNVGYYYHSDGRSSGSGLLRNTGFIDVQKGQIIAYGSYVSPETSGLSAILNVYDLDEQFVKNITKASDHRGSFFEGHYVAEFDCKITLSTFNTDLYTPYAAIYGSSNPTYGLKDVKEQIREIKESSLVPLTNSDVSVISPNSTIIMSGASFAYSANGWFELMCSTLGVTGINKSASGRGIGHLASQLYNNTFYNQETLNSTDALIIMQVWNYNINARKDITINDISYTDEQLELWTASDYEATGWSWLSEPPANTAWNDATMSAMWDYTLKKLQAVFYAEKDNPLSDWYGSIHGKPFNVVLTTHWLCNTIC